MSESITNVEAAVRELGALPVPVGPKPLSLPEEQMEALVAAGNRVVNNGVHEHLCMCDAWPEKCVSTGNYYMGAWDVSGLEDALPAVLALWEQMRGGELLRLRARVAELEAERHSTNEALSEAAEALRALRKDEPAEPRDFFQPGRTYLRFVGDREFYFRVTSVSTDNPNRSDSLAGDGPVAYGWGRTDRSTTVWGPTGQTSFVGWHDVTESGGA